MDRTEAISALMAQAKDQGLVVVEEVNSSLAYVGWCISGTFDKNAQNWLIARIVSDSKMHVVEFSQKYAIWANRGTLFPSLPAPVHGSVTLDGIDDYISFGDVYGFSPTTAFSVSVWIKPQNTAAVRTLVSKTSDDINVYGWGIYQAIGGNIQIQARVAGSLPAPHVFLDAFAPAGNWTHVVCTYSGGGNFNGWRVFTNSVASASVPASAVQTASWASTYPLRAGQRGSSLRFSGSMCHLSIWDKELDQSEVSAIYAGGAPPSLNDLAFSSHLKSWWPMAVGSFFPVEPDVTSTVNGTLAGTTAAAYTLDYP